VATKTIALLLSGGAGTRLWPMSTEAMPKQFLPLFGQRSLYQMTLARLAEAGVDSIWVAANAAHGALLRDQATALGLPAPTLILEPARRDSAAAIAAGVAAILAAEGSDVTIAALPCDHMIGDVAGFGRTLSEAVALAALGYLGTFGIVPTAASPEFGYLQTGGRIDRHPTALAVARFHEKPSKAMAETYLAAGQYLWNSGMFVFRGDVFAAEASAHMPDIWDDAQASVAGARREAGVLMLDAVRFEGIRKTSIDYALFELSQRVGVVPAAFDWSDVGNWSATHAALATDGATATVGPVVSVDNTASLIVADGVPVVALGLEGLVVIATREGVFVAPRARAAEIKQLIAALPKG
jgi:mannose-1-phosphate guanylyltransferase/mannose-6-phosphate isomerase